METVTPRSVIREAFAAGMIGDGQGWMDMLKDRNAMTHEFNCATFERVAANIHGRYLHLFETLRTWLGEEEAES